MEGRVVRGEVAAEQQSVGVALGRRQPDAVDKRDLDIVAVAVDLTENAVASAAPGFV